MEWFKGFVAVLIAIVFTACFIGVLHYTSFERQHSHNYSHEHSYQEDGRSSQVEPPLKTSIPVLDCIPTPNAPNICERPNKSSQNQGLSNADHYSQIVMAFFAFFGLIVGGYGLYFLWRTVEYTRKASKSAEETLTVANDTLEATKINSRRELRAYLSVQNVRIMGKASSPQGTNDTLIKFDVVNSGQTPAYNVIGSIRAWGHYNGGLAIENLCEHGSLNAGGFTQVHKGTARQAEYEGQGINFDRMIETVTEYELGRATEVPRYFPDSKIRLLITLEYFDTFSVEGGDAANKFKDVFLYSQQLPTLDSMMWPEALSQSNIQIT